MRVKDKSELSKKEVLEAESEFLAELERNEFIPVPEVSAERQREIDEQRKRHKAEMKLAEKEAQKQRRIEKAEAKHKLEIERINNKTKDDGLKHARKQNRTRRREKVYKVIWFVVMVAVIIIFCNPSVREKVPIVTRNIGELVQTLLSGDRTTSTQAVDALRNLGKELNEANGYDYNSDSTEEGFSIDNAE